LILAALAIVLVLVAVGAAFLLPVVVRDRAVASAREAGFEISIERVGVGFGGVSLRGIQAKASRTPGITATIQEIFLAGTSASDVRILGPDAKLDGDRSDLEAGLMMLIASHRAKFGGTPSSPRHLSIVNARLTWQGITGEGSRLEAGGIGLELDSRSRGTED